MPVKRPDGTWLASKEANGDWLFEEIKCAVRMMRDEDGQAWSLERLALSSGLPRHACLGVRKGDAAGEAVVANLLGLMPRDIWPSRYRRDGSRINPARRRHQILNDRSAPRHRENRSAA